MDDSKEPIRDILCAILQQLASMQQNRFATVLEKGLGAI